MDPSRNQNNNVAPAVDAKGEEAQDQLQGLGKLVMATAINRRIQAVEEALLTVDWLNDDNVLPWLAAELMMTAQGLEQLDELFPPCGGAAAAAPGSGKSAQAPGKAADPKP
jgi:hypothetical protein